MKKEYKNPQINIIKIETEMGLAASGDPNFDTNTIPSGGDEEDAGDPQSKDNSWSVWDD